MNYDYVILIEGVGLMKDSTGEIYRFRGHSGGYREALRAKIMCLSENKNPAKILCTNESNEKLMEKYG